MKKTITSWITSLVFHLSLLAVAQAQGTIQVSNLGQPSVGSLAVGSDSWRAAYFIAGTNTAGYSLNSLQLAVALASGGSSGFTASIYTNGSLFAVYPGGLYASLTGNSDPRSAGLYTFSATSTILLNPNTPYHVIVTAATPIATGTYAWSQGSAIAPQQADGWWIGNANRFSNNGVNWVSSGNYLQFGINASAIPEPTVLALFGFGGVLLLTRRRLNL